MGRKINFTINYFRPFSLLLPFPKWKRDVQKQCLALNWPHAGKRTFAHYAFMSCHERATSVSIYFCVCREGGRALQALDADNGNDFACIPAVHTGSHVCCAREFIVPCPRKIWVSVKWETAHVCNREAIRAQENNKPGLSSARSRGWTHTGKADVNSWGIQGEWKTPPSQSAASLFPHCKLAPKEGKSRESRKGDGKLLICHRARNEGNSAEEM